MIDGEPEGSFAEFETQATPPAEVKDEPKPAEDAAEDEVKEPADPDAPPADEPAPKPKQTAQERIDEITKRSREAERDAKYWRDVAMGKVKANGGPPQEQEAKAPSPDDFDLGDADPKYIEAVIDFRVEQGLDKVRGAVAQDLQVQAGDRAWEARQDAARSKFDDYDAVVLTHDPVTGAPKWPCSEDAAIAIRQSDAGGEIAYHLASNPDEARRIYALPPHSQIREIGRIEATLETKKPASARTTQAPKPPESQVRGAGGQFAPDASTTDFAAFEAMNKRKT